MTSSDKTEKPAKDKKPEAGVAEVKRFSVHSKAKTNASKATEHSDLAPDQPSPEEARAAIAQSHPDGADPIVMPRQVRDRPGRLQTSQASITLQTRQAHALFYGRRGDKDHGVFAIVGLVRFASNVKSIWRSAGEDDPYADLALIEIENRFEAAAERVNQHMEAVSNMLDAGMAGINMPLANSVQPVTLDIQFYSPWAYQGAILLARYDKLVIAGMTARMVGLMLNDDWEASVVEAGSKIRGCFEASRLWVHTGVSRDDIAANNKVAQRALVEYAARKPSLPAMPEEVLRGDQRAKLSPTINRGNRKPRPAEPSTVEDGAES